MDDIATKNRLFLQQLAAGQNPAHQIQPGDESKMAPTLGNFLLNAVSAPPSWMSTVADDKQAMAALPQNLAGGAMGTTGRTGSLIAGNLEAILAKQASGKALSTAEQLAIKAMGPRTGSVLVTNPIMENTAGRMVQSTGIPGMAEGGDVPEQTIDTNFRIMSPEEQQQTSVLKPMPNMIPGATADTDPATLTAPPLENYQLPQQATVPEPVMSQNPTALGQSYENQVQGLQGQAKAEAMQGKAEVNAANEQVQKAQALEQQFSANYNHLEEQRQKIMSDIENNHIDPNRYKNNLGTGGKIQAAIGIFLSGLGQGMMGHAGNPALDFFNKQIDRDLDSQKANATQKQNMLSALEHQFGNSLDATNAMRVIYASKYAADVAKAAAASKDPMAKGRAQQLIGSLQAQYAPLMQQMALRQTMMQGTQSGHVDPAQAVPVLVPKEHQQAVFKEIERAQNTRHMASNILGAFDSAAKDVRPLSGGHLRYALPGVTSPHVHALHQHMQPTFQDLEGTVRQAAMDNTFENITPKTGDSDSTIAIKRQALEQYLQAKASAPTAKGFGLDLGKFESTKPIKTPSRTSISKPANYGR